MYCKLTGDGDLHYIPAETSPTGSRLEAPCVFEHYNQAWFDRVSHKDWVQKIGPEEYRRRQARESGTADGTPETVADKAAVARQYIDEAIPSIVENLPDERPTDEADPLARILYELLQDDDYNARRRVLGDVSEYPAQGGSEVIERRLYAELYDRQLAEG